MTTPDFSKMSRKATIKYFINKFEAIPDEKWCTKSLSRNGAHCALGHTGMTSPLRPESLTPESNALSNLIGTLVKSCHHPFMGVTAINDLSCELGAHSVIGDTPKKRILNALYAKLREGGVSA